MAEEFVRIEEFNNLKKDVEKIKEDMNENAKTLQSIDKKVDIIKERLISTDEISELKLKPIDKRVTDLEDNQKWLRKTVIGTLITLVIGIIVEVIKLIK